MPGIVMAPTFSQGPPGAEWPCMGCLFVLSLDVGHFTICAIDVALNIAGWSWGAFSHFNLGHKRLWIAELSTWRKIASKP